MPGQPAWCLQVLDHNWPGPVDLDRLVDQARWVALLKDAIRRAAETGRTPPLIDSGTLWVPKGASPAVIRAAKACFAQAYGPARKYSLLEAPDLGLAQVGTAGDGPVVDPPLIYGFPFRKP